jgi:hypothetical protein
VAAGLEAIVTRDQDDFAGSALPVYLPDDFLQQLPPPTPAAGP